MSWSDELTVIRRFLRDPNGLIWPEVFLRHLYNDLQQDFQLQTHVLEDVTTQRVPQLYHYSYQQDWEYAHLPQSLTQFYQCLGQHDELVFCHRWEPQQRAGIEADVSDYGAHFTHPWEGYMLLAGEPIKMRFPSNFNSVKYIAYDEEPIHALTKKQVQSTDPSWITTQGEPVGYYSYDEMDNSYVLYPRPSTAFESDVDGDGAAFYEEGDTESDQTGVIAVRDGSTDSTEGSGASVDIVDTTNNVFMVYDVSPNDVTAWSEEPAFPVFLRKYIRFGVIGRAYGANTDGRIPSLSEYWLARYQLGIAFTKRFVRNRRSDRDYRLTTKSVAPRRRFRHPRLPDTYPAVNP